MVSSLVLSSVSGTLHYWQVAAGSIFGPMSEHAPLSFKFIIVGATAVGKSALLLQLTEHFFQGDHEMTVGVEFGSFLTNVTGSDGRSLPVKLQVWDTAGQESFRSITRAYYRGAAGVLLVYDVSRRDSFTYLDSWLEEIRANGEREAVITLLGNKCDLESLRQVPYEEGRQWAAERGLLFLETSAKTAVHVEEAFLRATKLVVERWGRGILPTADAPGQVGSLRGASTRPLTSSTANKKDEGCCS